MDKYIGLIENMALAFIVLGSVGIAIDHNNELHGGKDSGCFMNIIVILATIVFVVCGLDV